MIATLFIWLLVFLFLLLCGALIDLVLPKKYSGKRSIDRHFFLGFIFTSALCSWLSIFIPVSHWVLLILSAAILILAGIWHKALGNIVAVWKENIKSTPKIARLLIMSLILIICYASASKIGLHDTVLYHAQNVKWIQEFSVVPGLGNLHSRFSFNSLFFPISSLFLFNLGEAEGYDILLYPVNGVAIIVLLSKVIVSAFRAFEIKNTFQIVFYSLILLPAVAMYPAWINAPSPDFISAVLVIYSFILLAEKKGTLSNIDWLLLIGITTTSITYKLSGVFIGLLLFYVLFTEKQYFTKRLTVLVFIAAIISAPFFIRNYYLSGYVIYPFPAIDVYNVDWKVPAEIAQHEKEHIANWAKVPLSSDEEVAEMTLFEWMPIWWKRKPIPMKAILMINALSIFSLLILLKKREKLYAFIMFTIIANLVFWFINGPDPRFVHGFIFVGLALNIATISTLFRHTYRPFHKTAAIIFLAIGLLIGLAKSNLTHGNFLLPKGLHKVSTKTVYTNFEYQVPVEKISCGNSELPCAPGKNDNLMMRGHSISDGFYTKKSN